jgi:hypothetical protein
MRRLLPCFGSTESLLRGHLGRQDRPQRSHIVTSHLRLLLVLVCRSTFLSPLALSFTFVVLHLLVTTGTRCITRVRVIVWRIGISNISSDCKYMPSLFSFSESSTCSTSRAFFKLARLAFLTICSLEDIVRSSGVTMLLKKSMNVVSVRPYVCAYTQLSSRSGSYCLIR